MMRFAIRAAVALLLIGGCKEIAYPPPPQRVEIARPARAILEMTGGRPEYPWGFIVSDVLPGDPNLNWRWTKAHPAFRFHLDGADRWILSARVVAAESVLSKTGPQRLTFRVNGTIVGAAALATPGPYDLTFPVPAAVSKGKDLNVEFEVAPCLTPDSRNTFGVLLQSIGFVQAQP